MNVKDLKIDRHTDTHKCPVCGDSEFRRVLMWDAHTGDGYETGDWVCDNSDCEYEASETKGGELIGDVKL